jgi:hypothetical protein
MRACLLALALIAAKPGPGVRQVAILGVQVEGAADPVIGAQLTGRLAEVIGRRRDASVITQDDVRALFEQESRKQLAGCSDESCLAEIAGALGADVVVNGRVSAIGKGFAVSLAAVDAKKARAINHVSEVWEGESIGLIELVDPMVDKLFHEGGPPLVGALELTGIESGSQILVDGQVHGTAPAGQMGGIPIGARKLEIVAEGYDPFARVIVIQSGRVTTVGVKQIAEPPKPLVQRWWFWGGLALIAGGAAAGGWFALHGGGSGSPGATGVNVSVNGYNAFTGGR